MPYANIKSYHVIPKVFFWLSRSFPPYLYFFGGRRNTAPRNFTCLGPRCLDSSPLELTCTMTPSDLSGYAACQALSTVLASFSLSMVLGGPQKGHSCLLKRVQKVAKFTNLYCWWFRNPANHLIWILYLSIYRVFHIPGGVNLTAQNQ